MNSALEENWILFEILVSKKLHAFNKWTKEDEDNFV